MDTIRIFQSFGLFILGLGIGIAIQSNIVHFTPAQFSPLGGEKTLHDSRPLDRYAIDALRSTPITGSAVVFGEPIATTSAYTVAPFSYAVAGKRITGLAHIPLGVQTTNARVPVVVQIRGFVDVTIYAPGIGTKRSAEVFATNGFLTLAPDFLGYGGSDAPSIDVFEERFETYTATLGLLASVKSIPFVDPDHVMIWGHSNGGQIALTVLAVTGTAYPTVLWAPVTKPFPYNILYYTDEFDDGGKELRRRLAVFEVMYDVNRYSFTHYLAKITAPIQIHQGTSDDAVPVIWSDGFSESLTKLGIPVEYFRYPGADHNLTGGADSWAVAISRSVEFFRTHTRIQ